MTLSEKLKIVRDTLLTCDAPVYHYTRSTKSRRTSNYIVWQETEESGGMSHDNHKSEQEIRGTVDLFTKVEFDPVADQIQEKLTAAARIAWRLNSVAYEEDNDLIHYEWEFLVH